MVGVPFDTRDHGLRGRFHRLGHGLGRWIVGACLLLPVVAALAVPLTADDADDPAFTELEDSLEPLLDVVIEGNKTIPEDEIARKIKTRPGRPPMARVIKEDVRALYATKWFFSVEPRYRQTDNGLILVFRVIERPILQKVEYKGNKKLKTKDLENLTGMRPGGAYDVSLNREAASRIRSYYQEKGFMFAEVTLDEGASKDDRNVVFNIKEGPKVHVTKVTFEGNKDFVDGKLKTKLKTSTRKLWLFGGKYDPATIPEDINSIKEFYHSLGYFDVQIKHREKLSDDKASVHLEYYVEEGIRYKVRDILFEGNEVIPTPDLKKDLLLKTDEYFTERKLNLDVEKVTNQYGELGRIFAVIDPKPVFLEEPGTVDLVYSINEDQPYTIRRINVHIDGEHPHTKEAVALNRMLVKPGELANPVKIKRSQQRLASSQIFAGNGNPNAPDGPKINVTKGEFTEENAQTIVRAQGLGDPSGIRGGPGGGGVPGDPFVDALSAPPGGFVDQPGPGEVDLDVNVAESQTGRLMFGVGVNSDAGVIGSIVLDENNFDILRPPTSLRDIIDGTGWRGNGEQFRIEAVPGNQVSRYLISWRNPHIFDSDYSFGVSGFYFNRFYPDWDETRTGGRMTLGRAWTADFSTTAALRLENVEIENPRQPVAPLIGSVEGNNTLSTVRVSAAHDTRDSPFLAGRGHFLELAYEQAFGDFTYPQINLDARQYFTVYERPDGTGRNIVTLAGQLGWSGDDTPMFERFYAGGFSSFRGFAFRGISPRQEGSRVGGTWQALGSTEYYFPITADDTLGLVAFTDFGTVLDDVGLDDFRASVGAGLRITVPALGPVPIALDWAVPLNKTNEDTTRLFSFYVGLNR
jgi:outer membrane protein insertion porin family